MIVKRSEWMSLAIQAHKIHTVRQRQLLCQNGGATCITKYGIPQNGTLRLPLPAVSPFSLCMEP